MKRRAILLAVVMVLSMMVAGVGASAPTASGPAVQASGPAQQAPEPAQQTTPQTNDSDTDERSAGTGQPAPPQMGEPPYPVGIPPSQLRNGSIDTSALPATMQGEGGYAMRPSAGYVTKANGEATRRPSPEYEVGGPQLRWPSLDATGQSGPENDSRYYFKNYTLKVVSPEVEIWVANDLSYPADDPRETPDVTQQQLLYLADEFTNNIEPKESDLYRDPVPQRGTDSPLYRANESDDGLPDDYYQSADNESRTVLLVDNVRDQHYYNPGYPTYIAGFFSPRIGMLTDRNVMTIDANAWEQRLGGPDAPWKGDDPENETDFGIESTTAHEYQHLLHSYEDPDEATWINEGLAEVTPYRVGYGVPDSIEFYEQFPSNSLIEWEDQLEENASSVLADYGAAGLFQLYSSQQFGIEFTKEVFNDDANGIQSVRNSLDDVGAERDFYSLYQDFSTALLTDGLDTESDRYQIDNVDFDVDTGDDVIYTRNNLTAAYGNTYEPLDLGEGDTLDDFSVSGINFTETPWETAEDPTGGSDDEVLWSTQGNNLDNFAIFETELSNTDSPTLNFDTYYDIERGFDYGFVQVSTDGGETWTSLSNENTTDVRGSETYIDPTVQANLPGFTGDTNGNWVTEEFDLSEYAGEEVLVAFRYVTDPASVQPGWYVRDISVSGTDISYSGASTEPFESLREARENYIRYQYSFVGITEDGTTEVEQLGPRTFENGSPMSLEQLPSGEFDRTVFTATWAPEMRDTGTVPYGYEVNPQEEPPGDGAENTLRIEGSGEYAFYSLRATSDVDGSGLTGEDTIEGSTAAGAVGGGSDTYTFKGDLRNLYIQSGATVFLNGERIDPDDYESVVSFEGPGSLATYSFAVENGEITGTRGLTGEDTASDMSADGAVAGGSDGYTFTGTFEGLDIDGDASVVLNGLKVEPSVFYNTISFDGFGTYATYEFTVTGEVVAGEGLTGEDSFAGDHGEGAVRSGTDTYTYSGTLEDVTFTTEGRLAIERNGETYREE